uniref:Uncharacterized protein n=1 Tax=Sus scrofa TaxID=9823 RepID=A0A8D0TZF3_PIG
RDIFSVTHSHHINMLSCVSEYRSFVSLDELRIWFWNLGITKVSDNISDVKPKNMDEIAGFIGSAELHPHHCRTFSYSSKVGTHALCIWKASACVSGTSDFLKIPTQPVSRSFTAKVSSSIFSVKLSQQWEFLFSSEYHTKAQWDCDSEERVIQFYQVHNYLISKLINLVEKNCIFMKYKCDWNARDSHVLTANSNNFRRMIDRQVSYDITSERSEEAARPQRIKKPLEGCVGRKRKKKKLNVDPLTFVKHVLHTAWKHSWKLIAVAVTNNKYLFQDKVQ